MNQMRELRARYKTWMRSQGISEEDLGPLAFSREPCVGDYVFDGGCGLGYILARKDNLWIISYGRDVRTVARPGHTLTRLELDLYSKLWSLLCISDCVAGFDGLELFGNPFSISHGRYAGMSKLPPRSEWGPAYTAEKAENSPLAEYYGPYDIIFYAHWLEDEEPRPLGEINIRRVLPLRWELNPKSHPLEAVARATEDPSDPLKILAEADPSTAIPFCNF